MKIPDIPNVIQQRRRKHPGEQMPDGLVLNVERRIAARPAQIIRNSTDP